MPAERGAAAGHGPLRSWCAARASGIPAYSGERAQQRQHFLRPRAKRVAPFDLRFLPHWPPYCSAIPRPPETGKGRGVNNGDTGTRRANISKIIRCYRYYMYEFLQLIY
jgi:hypothetical protein